MNVEKSESTEKSDIDLTKYSNDNRFDYVCSGGLVGEIGCMVKECSELTAECETAVTCYLMKAEDIDAACDMYTSLKQDIWKSIGISMAMNVIGEVLDLGSTPEQKRHFLEPSFLKELGENEQFIFDETISAAVV